MRNAMILACIILLSACSQKQWVKPGADAAQFQKDRATCEFEGTKAVAGSSNTITAFDQIAVENSCMRAKGWHKQ